MLRRLGYHGAKIAAGMYLEKRIQVPEDEKAAMSELYLQTNMRPPSSEKSIPILFHEGGDWAKMPIKDRIKEIEVPVAFVFG